MADPGGRRGVALGGFMGAGKSTVGPALAALLELDFADLDEVIVRDAGMPIRGIFAAEGEAGFRRREASAVERRCQQPPHVLALGGGTLHQPELKRRLDERFHIVVLDVPWAVLSARLDGSDARPLAPGAAALYAARRPGYLAAGTVVPVSRETPAEIATRIAQLVRAA